MNSGHYDTRFGGLFLFVKDLCELHLAQATAALPGSAQLPADCMIRSLLALKLWGIGCPSHVMPYILDEGPPLFGTQCVAEEVHTHRIQCTRGYRTVGRSDGPVGYAGRKKAAASSGSLDLDCHAIPHHGTTMEKHFVSSRHQRGELALVARDASQRALIYASAKITNVIAEQCGDYVCGHLEGTYRKAA
ncbi:MAG: hypothetical protein OXU68_08205 [Bacteroidota bacterium]|nr:hypothetical protein [Bacteroidota bacterium]